MHPGRALGLLLVVVGCAHAEAPGATPASTASVPTAPKAVALFCAHGGVGLVPVPTPPELETYFVTVVVDVDNPGGDVSGVRVGELSLLDASGGVEAGLRRVDHVVVLPYAPSPPPASAGWAFYLNPPGTPFSGTLPKGVTRLRVHASLKNVPKDPARFRLKLTGPSAPIEVEGKVDGVWAT